MPDLIEKARRQQEIFGVLREEVIASQEELRQALKRRGFPVAQATLSRDLKEMRIPCVPTGDGYRYAVPPAEGEGAAPAPQPSARSLKVVAALEVIGIDANEVGVVVHTLIGRAQGVAVYLDNLRLPDLLGTIAGDDTIFVIPRSIKRTARLEKKLRELLGLD